MESKLSPCVFNQTYKITVSEGYGGLPAIEEKFTPISREGKMYVIEINGERKRVDKRWFWDYGYFEPSGLKLF